VLSGRGLCDELITRPEESYRLCCVVVCDLETSRMGAPYICVCVCVYIYIYIYIYMCVCVYIYIYMCDISRLRVKHVNHNRRSFSSCTSCAFRRVSKLAESDC